MKFLILPSQEQGRSFTLWKPPGVLVVKPTLARPFEYDKHSNQKVNHALHALIVCASKCIFFFIFRFSPRSVYIQFVFKQKYCMQTNFKLKSCATLDWLLQLYFHWSKLGHSLQLHSLFFRSFIFANFRCNSLCCLATLRRWSQVILCVP